MPRRILFISSPASPIGQGDGGGVETTLQQLCPALLAKGHAVGVVAPAGSKLPGNPRLYQVTGDSPPNATISQRESVVTAATAGVVERMWEQANQVQSEYDVIVAMTYDWLSYYLTPFFSTPVLHWVTIASTIAEVDAMIAERYGNRPDAFAFYTRTQAATFPFVQPDRINVIPGAVDLDRFHFNPSPSRALCWAARISPEKGLEDAIAVARLVKMPLYVCGKIQDWEYWESLWSSAGTDELIYHGLVPHERLTEVLGRAAAMLVTPKWTEPFGLTVIEALACGTPVVAYRQGGPGEIVQDGKSGFLVPQNDVTAMADAVRRIGAINRADARRRAEEFSVDRAVEALLDWVNRSLQNDST